MIIITNIETISVPDNRADEYIEYRVQSESGAIGSLDLDISDGHYMDAMDMMGALRYNISYEKGKRPSGMYRFYQSEDMHSKEFICAEDGKTYVTEQVIINAVKDKHDVLKAICRNMENARKDSDAYYNELLKERKEHINTSNNLTKEMNYIRDLQDKIDKLKQASFWTRVKWIFTGIK